MVAWRRRKCPACGGVERASDYRAITPFLGWGRGAIERECPTCGYIAATAAFVVVREYHPGRPVAATGPSREMDYAE
jgi:hypothetical protein